MICFVQLAIVFLIRNVRGAFYSAGFSHFVPAPWAYPIVATCLIYTFRILLHDLGFSRDPISNAHFAFSETLFGPQNGPMWKAVKILEWVLAAILYLLVFGWVHYESQEDKKKNDDHVNKVLGDRTIFGNSAMSWRRQLKRAPTV